MADGPGTIAALRFDGTEVTLDEPAAALLAPVAGEARKPVVRPR